ncbi:MAG: hypothetical protein CME33_04295 [Gimesia sp.]|uniref:site-specific DNA-methyltransferase n=1 Tax=Gimesia sp. TaxID=2024833 RepID=UPI000C473B72|nr:site-specific DNA-methyltransferase [Gimesia sp.]MAX35773.1 hypothetical protein [Gimesia sp.]|tara:strand:+ start:3903 stop:5234 length:1332 start_codon:yes stop_codon:yes gene_type:complete
MNNENQMILDNYPPQDKGMYQVLGWMPKSEFAALLQSIQQQQQVQVPIIQDCDGNILDGHHRQLAHSILKIKEPLKVQTVGQMTENEKRRFVLSVNLVRRQISRQERRRIIGNELRSDPEMSNTQLAEICGTTKKTVRSVRDELVAKGEIPRMERTRRRNGGTYPLPHILTQNKRTTGRAQEAMKQLGDDVPRKSMTVRDAEGLVRRKQREQRINSSVPNQCLKGVKLFHSDFRDLNMTDQSVRLVITDPPYAKSALPLWEDLGKFAARILAPGGVLVSYSGISHLPQIMSALAKHLEYVWTISLLIDTGKTYIRHIGGRGGWRPIVVFAKEAYQGRQGFTDIRWAHKKEKDFHDWQQPLDVSRDLVEIFTDPGEMVCDPFSGSFTNGIAAYELGRRFIGCDIEEQNVRIGQHRLAEVIKDAKEGKAIAGEIKPAASQDIKTA